MPEIDRAQYPAQVQLLTNGHEREVTEFLRSRVESSMFFLSNLRAAGIDYKGQLYGGTYIGAAENGRVVGVVAHFWNGTLHLQAPHSLAALVPHVFRISNRPLTGLVGLLKQVEEVKTLLNLKAEDFKMDEAEFLYSLTLSEMKMPPNLGYAVFARRVEVGDFEMAVELECAYSREALGDEESPALREQAKENVAKAIEEGSTWVLEENGRIVARTEFNARIPDCVQIGGVYTPPELRGRGYARAVVAASLAAASLTGVKQAILFTGMRNVAAQKAYEALGFSRIGEFAISLLKQEIQLSR